MSKSPKVGDCFYNEILETTGRIAKLYKSNFSGLDVADVEYPGTDYEIEVYDLKKIFFRKASKEHDAAFVSEKGYTGE